MSERAKRFSEQNRSRRLLQRTGVVLSGLATTALVAACGGGAGTEVNSGIVFAKKDIPASTTIVPIIINKIIVDVPITTKEKWEIDFRNCKVKPCQTGSRDVSKRKYNQIYIGEWISFPKPNS